MFSRFFDASFEEGDFLMQPAEIKKMNTVERLRAMEALWDALIHEDGEPASPEWHGDILAERKRRMENGEMEFISLKELKARRHLS